MATILRVVRELRPKRQSKIKNLDKLFDITRLKDPD